MTSFSEALAQVVLNDGAYALALPSEWSHGETAAGSISAALCVYAADAATEKGLRLRSGHFAFAGPATGTLRATPRIVRRGRASAVVAVQMEGGRGAAVHAVLTYGASRRSIIDDLAQERRQAPPPESCGPFHGRWRGPASLDNFEVRSVNGVTPASGGRVAEFLLWARHRDGGAERSDAPAALLALADAAPPPVAALFEGATPAVTATWSWDLHHAPAETGWRLVHTRVDVLNEGYASHTMTVWSEAGARLLSGRQTVALLA